VITPETGLIEEEITLIVSSGTDILKKNIIVKEGIEKNQNSAAAEYGECAC